MKMFRRYLSSTLIAAVLLVLAASPAGAAKPGASTASSGPTLTGPTVAHVGETYTVNGSGFAPGSIVPLEVAEAGGCCIALNMVADENGAFSYSGLVYAPGAYRVRAFVYRNARARVAASWSFDAYL
jgi:hypothetical protein